MSRIRYLVSALVALLCTPGAFACDPKPGWKPPSPEAAFRASSVVVHARIVSQQGGDPSIVRVEVLHLLKGEFQGHAVNTASHSLCGVGQLKVGEDYVFFISDSTRLFVTHLNQPQGLTTHQVLLALRKVVPR
jgi:hypothetical protein